MATYQEIAEAMIKRLNEKRLVELNMDWDEAEDEDLLFKPAPGKVAMSIVRLIEANFVQQLDHVEAGTIYVKGP